MLKIKDKDGKLKFVLRDSDEEPVSIDELIIRENKKMEKEKSNADEEKSQ